MKRHRPRDGQVAILTLASSPLCPDMTRLASAKMYLSGKTGPAIEMDATLGSATRATVDCSHVWSATAGEAQKFTTYSLWAVGVTSSGVSVQSDPLVFEIIHDQDTER